MMGHWFVGEGFWAVFEKVVAVGKMCQTKHCLMRGFEKVFDPQNVVKIIAFLEPRCNTASGYQYPFNCKIPGRF